MAIVDLNPARLVIDSDTLHSIAQTARQAAVTCRSALASTGGMAGDEESAEVFANGLDGEPGYNDYAKDVLQGVVNVANTLLVLDAALTNTARAYDGAQYIGAFRSAEESPIAAQTATTLPSVGTVPTALGPGPQSPLGEFAEFVQDALANLGVRLPDADTTKLATAVSAWNGLSTSLASVQSQVNAALPSAGTMIYPQRVTVLSCQTTVSTQFSQLSASASSMAAFAQSMIDETNKAWEEIGWFLAQMAAEILLEIGIGVALSFVTFGAGAAVMAAKIVTTVMRWAIKIANLCRRLRGLIQAALRAARAAVRMGVRVARETISAGLASGISAQGFNMVRGAIDPDYQPQNVLAAALSGAAGGAAGGVVSRVGGGSVTSRVTNPALNRATHIAVETGSGAIDGLVSGGVESLVSGEEFNPLGAVVLGSLLGGAMAGKPGVRPSVPSAGNGAGATPGVNPPATPTPASSGTGSTPGSASGATPVSLDPATPIPGGGGASSTPAGGGGITVSADGPTPGSGGTGTSPAGDGTSVDVSSSAPDAPASLDIDTPSAPSSPDAPSAPAADAPSAPAADAPSSPSTPDAPTAPAADAPSAPSTPSSDAPSAPDAPSTPDAPAAPAADAPSTPDAPSSPSAEAPSAPTAPSADAPSAPAGDAPSTPAADAPATPAADAPSTPSADAPVGDAPTAPASDAPSSAATPAADATSAPAADAPVTAVSSPSGPAADAPSSVDAPAADAARVDQDAPTHDAPAQDAPAQDAPAQDASSPEGDASADAEASPLGDIDPEVAAAAGGAAAAGAGILGKPFVRTPSGSSMPSVPAAPDASAPAADGHTPDAPGTDGPAPDSSAPDAPVADGPASDAPSDKDADAGKTDESTGVDQSELTIEQIDTALRDINPNYDVKNLENGFATNCGHTSSILNDVLNGRPTREAPGGSTLSMKQMAEATGRPQVPATPAQIEATLRAEGAGAHAVVGIDRAGMDGHWFNVYFDGSKVWTLDAQTGARGGWPPHEPHATLWDVSIDKDALVNADGSKVYPEPKPETTPDGSAATNPDAPATPDAPQTPDAPNADAPQSPDAPVADGHGDADSAGDADRNGGDRTGVDEATQRRIDRWDALIDSGRYDEHVVRFFEGEIFNLQNHHRYEINELHVTQPGKPGSSYARIDSVSIGRDVVSRKDTQLGAVQSSTVQRYIRELNEKYGTEVEVVGPDGHVRRPQILVADTPSNRRDLEAAGLNPDRVIGQPLAGDRILEVPVQFDPPRREDLLFAAAARPEVIVRDVNGTTWRVEGDSVVETRADGTMIYYQGEGS